MIRRIFVSVAITISCALLLAACGGSEAPANNASPANSTNKTTTTTTTTTTTPATTASTPAASTTAATGDKIGVPECDDFLTKYEACVTGKVPEAARAQFNTSLKQWRDAWRSAASTPQGKAGLAQGCKMVAEQSKVSMKSFGCEL